MNANFSLPVLTSTYANFLAEMKSRDEDIAVWFENTTSTNLPIGAKKWNSTGSKFEKWNGATWSDLSTLYEIKVRDSDKLNGQTASYYAVSAHGHSAVTTTANGFMSYPDKVKLNAIAANANNYSHPAGDGNLHVPANGTANNGKFLQATATAGIYAWAFLPATSLSTLGVTATAAELNKLDGVTATATHFNYINTLSSNAQTQLNGKAATNQTMYIGTTAVAINRASAALTLGVSISGNAATATTAGVANSVSAAVAGAAIAGLSAGAVGSYIFAMVANGINYIAGSTVAGSNLSPTGIRGFAPTESGVTLSGTWRCMGHAPCETYGDAFSTLWIRIA